MSNAKNPFLTKAEHQNYLADMEEIAQNPFLSGPEIGAALSPWPTPPPKAQLAESYFDSRTHSAEHENPFKTPTPSVYAESIHSLPRPTFPNRNSDWAGHSSITLNEKSIYGKYNMDKDDTEVCVVDYHYGF